jgi:transposase InsO family protein
MDLGEQAHRVKFMIRDRGSNYTAAFDAVLADAGIRTVLCNVRMPRMNAIAERWIGGCRRELLDRALVRDQAHLRRMLRKYETQQDGLRGEVPGSQIVNPGLFRAAFLRTQRAPFGALGSLVTYAVFAMGFAWM